MRSSPVPSQGARWKISVAQKEDFKTTNRDWFFSFCVKTEWSLRLWYFHCGVDQDFLKVIQTCYHTWLSNCYQDTANCTEDWVLIINYFQFTVTKALRSTESVKQTSLSWFWLSPGSVVQPIEKKNTFIKPSEFFPSSFYYKMHLIDKRFLCEQFTFTWHFPFLTSFSFHV